MWVNTRFLNVNIYLCKGNYSSLFNEKLTRICRY